jgi:hypothetical protein
VPDNRFVTILSLQFQERLDPPVISLKPVGAGGLATARGGSLLNKELPEKKQVFLP